MEVPVQVLTDVPETSSNSNHKILRFVGHWTLFSLHILICSILIMLIEKSPQKERFLTADKLRMEINDSKTILLNETSLKGVKNYFEDYNAKFQAILDIEKEQEWTLVNSVYYCNALYTTVGYGDILVKTNAGKIFTMVFILTTVPIWFCLLAELGALLNRAVKKFWQVCSNKFNLQPSSTSRDIPVWFVFVLTVSFLLMAAQLVGLFDQMDYLDSMYFCIVTFSTVGLGDYVPNSIPGKLRCMFVTFVTGFIVVSAWVNQISKIIFHHEQLTQNINSHLHNIHSHMKRSIRRHSFSGDKRQLKRTCEMYNICESCGAQNIQFEDTSKRNFLD